MFVAELDIEGIPRLKAHGFGVGGADHNLAVGMNGDAESCLSAPTIFAVVGVEGDALGREEGIVEIGEVDPNSTIFGSGEIATFFSGFAAGEIAQLLDLLEEGFAGKGVAREFGGHGRGFMKSGGFLN